MALRQMLHSKAACAGDLAAEHIWLLRDLSPDRLSELGFNPGAYTDQFARALRMLEGPGRAGRHAESTSKRPAEVRRVALEMLGEYGSRDQPALAQHAHAIVRMLEDMDGEVRVAAVTTLGKLESRALERCAPDLLHMLSSPRAHVREASIATLGKLEPSALADCATEVAQMLTDSNVSSRGVANPLPARLID